MNHEQYKSFVAETSAVEGKARKHIHCVAGALSEIGELIGVIRKSMFYGESVHSVQDRILDEMGDVCWFLTEGCLALGWGPPKQNIPRHFDNAMLSIERLYEPAAKMSQNFPRPRAVTQQQLRQCWFMLDEMCYMMKITRETLYELNAEKLRARIGSKKDKKAGGY